MSSKLFVLLFILLLCVASLASVFVVKYMNMKEEFDAKSAELAAWRSKYALALAAQQASERAIEQLQSRESALMTELASWRKEYDAIDRSLSEAQKKIRTLETENEEIRSFLDTRVPDVLWQLLFPTTEAPAGGNSRCY